MARDRDYIGTYRLLKLVRAGATCQIWEAIRGVDNTRCALKTLQEKYESDKEQIALLKHEYIVGREFHHPCVIEIYEFDVSRGVAYVALEYFESKNLKQWIRQFKDSEDVQSQIPPIIQKCAEGLQYVHEHGWIHRDVKPDNFLVNDQGGVKLIDFAIAEKEKKGFGRFLGGKSKIQGTRSYMSPEQIRGEAVDRRSDIYSFGCMLFEFHCGRPPFTGGSPDELLQKHLRAPIPPLTANHGVVSSEYSKLVTRMMAKKRENRPATMKDFLDEFSSLRSSRTKRR